MKEKAKTVAELVADIFEASWTVAEFVKEILDHCDGDSVIVRGLILREVCDLESGVLEEDHELGWWRYTFPDGSRLEGTEEGFGVAS